jgi:hypothetical protein
MVDFPCYGYVASNTTLVDRIPESGPGVNFDTGGVVAKSTVQHVQDQSERIATTIAVAIVAPLVIAVGVLGGIGSFTAVRHLAEPWFGASAWTIPVGIDVGILALLAWDLLAEYLRLGWPVLRWTAWAFVGATTYLNVAAAHGSPTAAVMHAAMPILFVTVIEGVRHLIRQHTGLATGIRIERIPLSRWLLAPRTTFLLARRMVLWHVTSYQDGLALEYQRLLAVSELQQAYGRWCWRWRAPLQGRLALRLMPTDAPRIPATPPRSALSGRDQQLVDKASTILRQASDQGIAVSQAALGRQLRAAGHTVGNDRLHWLMTTARTAIAGTPDS